MKFGITEEFTCSYLPEKKERLLVCMEDAEQIKQQYEHLIQLGFRRSGDQIYRPHCLNCNACESLRIPVNEFQVSKSQKRVLTKNKDVRISFHDDDKQEYYELYERYINQVHQDSSMYPPSKEQYYGFIKCSWNQPIFIEGRKNGQLIGVAVTDKVPSGLSALYTFFAPELAKLSLGTLFILKQIALCKTLNRKYLYLGYQIDQCRKMNYKSKFYPHQRFSKNSWVKVAKP